jgi:baseplate J-like protein|nr:MAG TPA: Baseplate J like protein [Bacteriophage sp.]
MDNSYDAILYRLKEKVQNPASKIEGSFTYDNLSSVANELAKFYSYEVGTLLDRIHIDTAAAEDLDRLGKFEHNIQRLDATYEEAVFKIYGEKGKTVADGTGIKSEDTGVVFYVRGDYIIGDSGVVTVAGIAAAKGSGYRLYPNAKLKFLERYIGLSKVEIDTVSSGGYDRESDENYRKRIHESEANVVGYGNVAWYKATAKSVTGVDKVKVIDLARGPGTVDVLIVAKGNEPANETLIKKVKDVIESNRLAGADVQIKAANTYPINISATIRVKNETYLEDIKTEFKKSLNTYFSDLDFDTSLKQRVSYAKILGLLLNIASVTDVDSMILNKGNISIDIEPGSFPVIIGVNIEVAR